MKKFTFLGVFLILACTMTVSAQDRDLNTLLNDLKEIGNTTPISEKQAIEQYFNVSEQAMILNHFAEQNVLTNDNSVLNRGGGIVHVLNVRGGLNFGTLPITPPFSAITTIADPLGATCFADDFGEDGITLYAVDSAAQELVTVDTTDGTVSVVAALTGLLTDHSTSGLSYDFTTSTMYLLSTDGVITQLYTLDTDTGSLTSVGVGTGQVLGINLVIDNNGSAYSLDIGDDNIYSIDLISGVGLSSAILPVDANFAQDATVDPITGTIYMAVYTGGGTGGIYSFDPGSGTVNLEGDTFGLNAEFGMFSMGGVPNIASVDENQLSDLSIFPNPSNGGIVNIETRVNGDMQVAVYDVLGKQVINTVTTGDLNVSSLKAGVYMVNVTQDGSSVTKKLVIR